MKQFRIATYDGEYNSLLTVFGNEIIIENNEDEGAAIIDGFRIDFDETIHWVTADGVTVYENKELNEWLEQFEW